MTLWMSAEVAKLVLGSNEVASASGRRTTLPGVQVNCPEILAGRVERDGSVALKQDMDDKRH